MTLMKSRVRITSLLESVPISAQIRLALRELRVNLTFKLKKKKCNTREASIIMRRKWACILGTTRAATSLAFVTLKTALTSMPLRMGLVIINLRTSSTLSREISHAKSKGTEIMLICFRTLILMRERTPKRKKKEMLLHNRKTLST
jgi:hypothetical protein